MAYRLGIVSDLHVFSRYGLIPPAHLSTAKLPTATVHEYLWKCWEDFCTRCPRLDALIVNGDWIEGENPTKRDAMDAVTDDENLQIDAAVETLRPLREKATDFWVVRGTPWHEGKHFTAVESAARQLDANRWTDKRYTGLVLEGSFHGLSLNVTHHMTTGAIYAGTLATRTNLFAAAAELLGKTIPADVIIRSHAHMKFIGKTLGKWVVQTPAWKVVNPYAIKRMEYYRANLLSDIGALVLTTEGHGDVSWTEFDYLPPQFAPRDINPGTADAGAGQPDHCAGQSHRRRNRKGRSERG